MRNSFSQALVLLGIGGLFIEAGFDMFPVFQLHPVGVTIVAGLLALYCTWSAFQFHNKRNTARILRELKSNPDGLTNREIRVKHGVCAFVILGRLEDEGLVGYIEEPRAGGGFQRRYKWTGRGA